MLKVANPPAATSSEEYMMSLDSCALWRNCVKPFWIRAWRSSSDILSGIDIDLAMDTEYRLTDGAK
jgi:hypothetical protein